ncbi:hypothetical protein NEHOM01_0457 [Nematocida homosporus]|uniref:uncharacterized protein n=1 Tax=Nematocida homosporus TaxID=1912981 RepID=UPI002220EDB0|nr:uncharacterized protein NEHOM01_0457 [Nematocida homosporus]KAI5184906.1 hypothetical protein NEHOM01_0457 [Nematocida homosporus]
MDADSLGATVRRLLLKYADLQSVSTWEYSSWDAAWNTLWATRRTLLSGLVAVGLCGLGIGFVFFRKRLFTQKDTLCIFIYMVVTVFLLESVQKMTKIDVQLDSTYQDVDVPVPIPLVRFGRWTVAQRAWCASGTLSAQIEKRTDDLRMGETAANAYRHLIRNNLLRKRGTGNALLTDDNDTLDGVGTSPPESAVLRVKVKPRRTLPEVRQSAEYCIFQGPPQKCTQDCLYLGTAEFAEAKQELAYIAEANRQYREIQKDIAADKKEYVRLSVDLMKNYQAFSKRSIFILDELETVGVSSVQMEKDIRSLLAKYDDLFSRTFTPSETQIVISPTSLCVKIGGGAKPYPKPYTSKPVGQSSITQENKIVIQETVRPASSYLLSPVTASLSETTWNTFHRSPKLSVSDPAVIGTTLTTSPVFKPKNRNSFFISAYTLLAICEIMMFIQVFLVLGVIIAAVLNRRLLYLCFYFAICASLALALLLSLSSLSFAASFAALCRRGLRCTSRSRVTPQPMQVADLIDLPQRALSQSIQDSEASLKSQIDALLLTNTSEDIQNLSSNLQRLFQVKKDFPLLLAGNANRNLVQQNALYSAANGMNQALNGLRRLDNRLRSTPWSSVFQSLAQISVLLNSDQPNTIARKRKALATLAGAPEIPDTRTCAGKETAICELKNRFDSLFIGLFLFSVILPLLIAI